MKATIFIPCFVDLLYPQVGISMVKIIERLGHSVEYPEEPTCCGQPAPSPGFVAMQEFDRCNRELLRLRDSRRQNLRKRFR